MTKPHPKRRFIAGATCPSCGNMDTVYIVRSDDGESRHCTRCDLSEKRPTEVPAEDPVSTWQPVRLQSPPESK